MGPGSWGGARNHVPLAILGAGPVGLDAALLARSRGIDFVVFEAGPRIGHSVRQWAHVRMFSPWPMNVSPRMREVLAEVGISVPGKGAPTGGELVDLVLEPIGGLDGIADRIRTGHRVVQVSREGLLKSEEIGTGMRGRVPFRILVEDETGREAVFRAGAVLDCTGTWSHPNPLGRGGIWAPGERTTTSIERHLPDLKSEPEPWRDRRVLLVGAGHSGQTFARDFARLAQDDPGTQLIWAFRGEASRLAPIEGDPLPLRAELARAAHALARGDSHAIEPRPGWEVEAFRPSEEGDRTVVTLVHEEGRMEDVHVDRIVGLTGASGDPTLYRQLQVHECYATSGTMKLAAALLGAGGATDCLAQGDHVAEVLVNPEPDFFVLGSKSYGSNATFLLRTGWEQVEQVFGLLEKRAPFPVRSSVPATV